jgi:hypothetical protein
MITCTVLGMSASWEVASATQIFRSGAAETGTLATQVADHIGYIAYREIAGCRRG